MEPILGQLQLFAFNFAPRGWAMCNGQLLSISQYSALFSLLGTTYGGDGRSTFALPDLRGRVPIHFQQSPGLSNYALGQRGGVEQTALTIEQMPSHTHQFTGSVSLKAADERADSSRASNDGFAAITDGSAIYANDPTFDNNSIIQGLQSDFGLDAAGGGIPHDNRPPFLAMNWCIALMGIYPSRN
ncbi:MAG: tail fiber protein [Bacteroidota bacterium]